MVGEVNAPFISRPDLHVRSNSKPALERVLAAVAGEKKLARLGDSAEFRYIRTLMPRGVNDEDGLIYLSDPFIRRLVTDTPDRILFARIGQINRCQSQQMYGRDKTCRKSTS